MTEEEYPTGDPNVAEAFTDAPTREDDPPTPSYDEVPPPQVWMSTDEGINAISELVRTAIAGPGPVALAETTIPVTDLLRIIDLVDPSRVDDPRRVVVDLDEAQTELVLETLEEGAVRLVAAGILEDASILWSVIRAVAGDEPYDPIEIAALSIDAQVRNATIEIQTLKAQRKFIKKALKKVQKQL